MFISDANIQKTFGVGKIFIRKTSTMSKRNLLQYENMEAFAAKEGELLTVTTTTPGVASVKTPEKVEVFYNNPKTVQPIDDGRVANKG